MKNAEDESNEIGGRLVDKWPWSSTSDGDRTGPDLTDESSRAAASFFSEPAMSCNRSGQTMLCHPFILRCYLASMKGNTFHKRTNTE